MDGKLAIEVTKEGIMNCMHNVATLLEMSETELGMYCLAETVGYFNDSTETLGEGKTREEAERNMEKNTQSTKCKTACRCEEGELVKVRDDLIQYTEYKDESGCEWAFVMKKYAGCVGHVTEAYEDNTYRLDVDNGRYYYPAIFLEPVYGKED